MPATSSSGAVSIPSVRSRPCAAPQGCADSTRRGRWGPFSCELGTLVTLAWAGVAAAATPEGQLTGSDGLHAVTTTIKDGGTSFVGLENDKSGNCNGDSGEIFLVAWDQPEPVVCAHYLASSRDGSGPKMRFATPNPFASGCYDVWRISDGARGLEKFAFGQTCPPNALAQAKSWVNLGAVGAGFGAGWGSFAMVSGYTITP